MENKHAKRVDIVSIKMVREGSTKYENRKIETPFDAYVLLKNFKFIISTSKRSI